MTFKPGRKFYIILIICTFLWNQQPSFFTQKNNLENSYRDKVISVVSRLLGQDNFIVIINIDVDKIQKKTGTLQSRQGSSNGYYPIPGLLPTLPSRDGSSPSSMPRSKQMGENNYSISNIKVNIELDEELLLDPSLKQEIKALVKKVIPEIRDCEDCIKIGVSGFLHSKKSTELQDFPLEKSQEIEDLKKEIEDLKSAQRQIEEGDLKKELQDAIDRLEEAKTTRRESNEKINSWENELARRDSLEYERLIKFEKNRYIEDSTRNNNTERELRQVRDRKMLSDSTHLSTALSIVDSLGARTLDIIDKQVGSKAGDKEEALLGMQIGSGGSGIMSAVIFILLIICLLIITFLAASNKKPKPIYLKPKTKKKEPENSAEINEGGTGDKTSSGEPTPVMRHDEDAIRSELRSLRQTAVSLTVGEKESASSLIKEWLEDNPNKGENPVGE